MLYHHCQGAEGDDVATPRWSRRLCLLTREVRSVFRFFLTEIHKKITDGPVRPSVGWFCQQRTVLREPLLSRAKSTKTRVADRKSLFCCSRPTSVRPEHWPSTTSPLLRLSTVSFRALRWLPLPACGLTEARFVSSTTVLLQGHKRESRTLLDLRQQPVDLEPPAQTTSTCAPPERTIGTTRSTTLTLTCRLAIIQARPSIQRRWCERRCGGRHVTPDRLAVWPWPTAYHACIDELFRASWWIPYRFD